MSNLFSSIIRLSFPISSTASAITVDKSSSEIPSTVNQKSPLLTLGIPLPSVKAALANLSASSL